jgi:anti-anti-sigma factor
MEIVETRSAHLVTLAIHGRLDAAFSGGFEQRILACIDAGDRRVIVDLAELDYINSVGLRVLMLAAKRLQPVGGRIVLCALQPSIRHVFDIAGLSSTFAIATTREEATALFAP